MYCHWAIGSMEKILFCVDAASSLSNVAEPENVDYLIDRLIYITGRLVRPSDPVRYPVTGQCSATS